MREAARERRPRLRSLGLSPATDSRNGRISGGTAMYLFLFLLFRVVVKRRVGSIGMADILILVIVAD